MPDLYSRSTIVNDRTKPVTLPPELVQELWCEIKSLWEVVAAQAREAERREVQLKALLHKMKEAGMADWIPTLEEVQEAFKDHFKDQE